MNITDIDWRTGDQVELDGSLKEMVTYTSLLIDMVHARVDDDAFPKIVEFVFNLKETAIAYMDDMQVEQHLKYCALWKATFKTLSGELQLLLDKATRNYKVWWARVYETAKKELLAEQRKEIKDGYRTKGGYGNITKDDITNRVLLTQSFAWANWNAQLDDIKRTVLFFEALTDDLKHRSYTLCNVNKEKGQF